MAHPRRHQWFGLSDLKVPMRLLYLSLLLTYLRLTLLEASGQKLQLQR